MTQVEQPQKIAEGREAEIFAWENGAVLRLFRNQRQATSLDREVAAMQAAAAVTPFVPAVLGRTEHMGRPGLIMERIDGADLLSLVGKKPWKIWHAGRICGDVHARLHGVIAPPALDSLKDRGRRLAAESSLIPAHIAQWGLSRLEALPDGDRILHGDFHPGNVLMSGRGPIVIDWPNATAGDPDADVARTLLMIAAGALPPGTPLLIRLGDRFGRRLMRAAYLRGYRSVRAFDPAAVEAWLPVRAIDRLAEDIPDERATLSALIERAMRTH